MYRWYKKTAALEIFSHNLTNALILAAKAYRHQSFRMVHCGYIYTLPERDEHGNSALFCELAQSHKSPNGIFFSKERGYSLYVQNASSEALNLLSELNAS